MRQLAQASSFALALLAAVSVQAQVYPSQPGAVPDTQEVLPYPPDQVYGPQPEPGAPVDPNDERAAYPQTPDTDVTADDNAAQGYEDGYDPQGYAQFENALAAYGTWVDDPTYGRVWVPYDSVVGDDFTPYASNGQWNDTEYGWTWVSDWDWGWAPFHFGRWAVMAGHGWGWVPGTVWGPGWVSWRVGGGYVGWAALPPRGTTIGRPVGTRSPWRFTQAASLGTARRPYLTAAAVPGMFSRMAVVSNQRTLSSAHGPVLVNAGPPRSGRAAPGTMAAIAPNALPKFAIHERVGVPIASRPWAVAGGYIAPLVRGSARARAAGQSSPSGPARSLRPARAPMSRPTGRSLGPHG